MYVYHIYNYIFIHTYIHAYIHTYMHACIHTYMHRYVRTYTHTYIHACMHACIHPYIQPSIHPSIHTYVHTYIYIYSPLNIVVKLVKSANFSSRLEAQRSRGTEVVQSPYQGLEENLKRCKMHQAGGIRWGNINDISYIYILYM